MSGPKCRIYQLTEAERARIKSDILNKSLRRTIKMMVNEANVFINQTNNNPIENKKSQKRLVEAVHQDEIAVEVVNDLRNFISSVENIDNIQSSEFLRQKEDEGERLLEQIKKTSKQVKKSLNITLNKEIDKVIRNIDNISFNLPNNKKSEETDVKDKVDISELKTIIENRMDALTIFPLSKPLINDVNNAREKLDRIVEFDFLKNFKAITLTPLVNRCERYIEEREELNKEFDRINRRYIGICDILSIEPEKIPFSENSIEIVQNKISDLQLDLINQTEQDYIANTIDEVMAEMGYDILGNKVVNKRSGKSLNKKLYAFEEGTAVNITQTSDGRVTMEIGGVDYNDRIPSGDEGDLIVSRMEDFCDDFEEIERKLIERGVIVKEQISMLPPRMENAQIINVSDYDVDKKINKMNVNKMSKKRKKVVKKVQRKSL